MKEDGNGEADGLQFSFLFQNQEHFKVGLLKKCFERTLRREIYLPDTIGKGISGNGTRTLVGTLG